LINAPTKGKPYHQHYTVQLLGNVVGGRPTSYINGTVKHSYTFFGTYLFVFVIFSVPMEEFKKYTMTQIKEGETVWFGCDVGKHFHRSEGILDTRLFDYELVRQNHFCT